MAKKKPSKILIGLFVVVGSVIGIGTIIWVGASNYFERGTPYVTYFDESVQGLNPDSRVKLRGVNIGRVKDINVDAGSARVEVIMSLDPEEPLGKNVCAELKSVGLTGIMFIDLDLKDQGELLEPPPANARTDYPVIPSRPSKTKQIMSGIDSAIQKFNAIRTETIIRNLESATARFDRTMGRVDKLLTDGRIDRILDETKSTLTEARGAVRDAKTELGNVKLKETSAEARKLLEGLGQDSRRISMDLRATGENLRNASERLDDLLRKVESDPSQVLFPSRPLPRKRPAEN